MRVVLDTGVLVSGLLSHSAPPTRVLGPVGAGGVTVLVSKDLAEEYREVLARPPLARLGTLSERMELLSSRRNGDYSHRHLRSSRWSRAR